jgi:hypothetical protein
VRVSGHSQFSQRLKSVGEDSVVPRSLCHRFSFAPSRLAQFQLGTHGLRRGLYPCAASRLGTGLALHSFRHKRVQTQASYDADSSRT